MKIGGEFIGTLNNILNPLNNFDSFSFLYFATIYLGGKYEKYRNTYER